MTELHVFIKPKMETLYENLLKLILVQVRIVYVPPAIVSPLIWIVAKADNAVSHR
jgi:hypothetical protein